MRLRALNLRSLPKEKWFRVLFILLPILILGVDFLLHPLLFHSERTTGALSIMSLLMKQPQLLGTYKAHRIHASIDDLGDARPLAYLTTHKNALVISAFVSEGEVAIAALGNGVLQKLKIVSPQDRQNILDSMGRKTSLGPGDVMKFEFRVPEQKYGEFPIDYLYMVLFQQDRPVDIDTLKAGLPTALSLAARDGVKALVLPCLGSTWENKNTVSLDEFFPAFFTTLPDADSPRDIYISLYRQWPSFHLEDAVRSMNTSWEGSRRLGESQLAIYRMEFRSMLIFWSVCVLVCSFYAPLSLKNFLIVSASFLGLGSASNAAVKFFTGAYPGLASIINIAVLAVVAFGFPFIVNWNPKDIFSKDRQQ
jgi:hypothetical protein